MPDTQQRLAPIHSSLEADPTLWEMVELFVADMPKRIARMERQLDTENWPALSRTAHQLKGAAGSYGFDALTEPAWRLELALRERASHATIQSTLQDLIAQCRRISAGLPPHGRR